MEFYYDAIKVAKEQNVELSETCKKIFLSISLNIQNLSLEEKRDFLETLIDRWELN